MTLEEVKQKSEPKQIEEPANETKDREVVPEVIEQTEKQSEPEIEKDNKESEPLSEDVEDSDSSGQYNSYSYWGLPSQFKLEDLIMELN